MEGREGKKGVRESPRTSLLENLQDMAKKHIVYTEFTEFTPS